MEDKDIWLQVDDEMEKGVKIDSGGGNLVLPLLDSYIVKQNFKGMPIVLSRYKFAAKMLEGKKKVLDIGCNAGFKTQMFKQFIDKTVGMDFDEEAIEFAKSNYQDEKISFICQDILNSECEFANSVVDEQNKFDGVVSMDVIEHISKDKEDLFMTNILYYLKKQGICIIGTPNITAQEYQSDINKIAHINLYSFDRLKKLMSKYFENVFLFGMNDEIVHTGFPQMAHYLIVMGVGKKR